MFHDAVKRIFYRIFAALRSDELELQLLTFPVFVAVLASVSILLGGQCALWQWWSAVGLSSAISIRKGNLRQVFTATGLLLAWLVVLWVLSGVLWTNCWNDYQQCYMPAVRMLIEGWNPFYEATPEKISSALSIDPSTFQVWHVLVTGKSTSYLNAVAYFFTHEPYNIMFPAYFLIFPQLVCVVWKVFCKTHWILRCLAIFILLVYGNGVFAVHDAIITLAAIGYILSLRGIAVGQRVRWGRIFCFSFWLLTIKPVGLVAFLLFGIGYVGVLLFQKRNVLTWKSMFLGGALVVTVLITSASPYFASWREYGHPLYPNQTCDAQRYPEHRLIGDFMIRNEDAVAMSHLGAAVNAFVSTSVAKCYYRWKFNNPKFAPSAMIWTWHHGSNCTSPTSAIFKFVFCLSALLCIIFGDKWNRAIVFLVLISVITCPTPIIGYLRYVSWWLVLPMLAFLSLPSRRWALVLASVGCFMVGVRFSMNIACTIEYSDQIRQFLSERTPPCVYVYYKPDCIGWKPSAEAIYNPLYLARANVELLMREAPHLARVQLADILPPQVKTAEELESYPKLHFDSIFRLPLGTKVLKDSPWERIQQEQRRAIRMLRYPFFVVRTLMWTFPQMICRRVAEII